MTVNGAKIISKADGESCSHEMDDLPPKVRIGATDRGSPVPRSALSVDARKAGLGGCTAERRGVSWPGVLTVGGRRASVSRSNSATSSLRRDGPGRQRGVVAVRRVSRRADHGR